jgi:hypothetical protein
VAWRQDEGLVVKVDGVEVARRAELGPVEISL